MLIQFMYWKKERLSETGSHEELLEQKGLYYALWRQQVGERIIKVKKPDELNSVLSSDIPDVQQI